MVKIKTEKKGDSRL